MANMKIVESMPILILCLSALSLTIQARVVPLLQNHERPSSKNVFDTSKYGILQLNNGLASTPQMGYGLFPNSCLKD